MILIFILNIVIGKMKNGHLLIPNQKFSRHKQRLIQHLLRSDNFDTLGRINVLFIELFIAVLQTSFYTLADGT